MFPETVTFAITILVYGAILLLLIHFLLTFADLEADHVNAQECCAKLNIWVVPKFGLHSFLCVLLLLGGHWVMFLLNIPMAIWFGYELYRQPRDSLGVYDPIDIHGRNMLRRHINNCMICLGYYFTMFFVALYCMMNAMIKGDPIKRHEEGETVTSM